MQNANGQAILATPYARLLAKQNGVDLSTLKGSGAYGAIKASDVLNHSLMPPRATLLAKRMAKANNIDLKGAKGTGNGGKVTKDDVLALMIMSGTAGVKAEKPTVADGDEIIKMTPMRRAIAKNMIKSTSEVPTVTHCVKIDVTSLLEIRESLNRGKEKADKLSLNDFFIMAIAKALVKNERFRMEYREDHFVLHNNINVGMAVGMNDGLVVPVIKDIDKKSIFEVSKDSKQIAAKAREGKLTPDDMMGAVITVSNLGMFGTFMFNPIINQPEAAIVGVCDTMDELELVNGQIAVRKKTILCTTYDHRVVNGTEAAAFSNCVRDYLENPATILV